jgi:hypothetical protein
MRTIPACALAGGRRGAQLERLPRIHCAASREFARLAAHRNRLSGDRGLVQHGDRTRDHAVHRHDLASAHQDRVADSDLIDRHVLDVRLGSAMGDFWRAIDQRSQVSLGASDGEILQNIAAGVHDRDDDPGEVLAERKRAGHRHKGDGVDPHAPREEVADHGDEQPCHNRRRAYGPAPVGPIAASKAPGEQAEREADRRD